VISGILFFPLSRKYSRLLSLDLPESKITTTTTTTDKEYLSQTRSDLFRFEKKSC